MLTAGIVQRWLPSSAAGFLDLLLDMTLCLGCAVLCGLLVGMEREKLHKPAGVRTHILVCLGSAGFVHIGVLAHGLGQLGSIADFNRLVQSVATGLGFLGAGAIFREGLSVTGVTTAASIWVTGAVGAAAGAGAIVIAVPLSGIAYVVLRWLRFLEARRPP